MDGALCGRHCGWCGRCTDGGDLIERTCARCGDTVLVSKSEPYRVQIVCDACWDRAVQVQERKAERRGAA